MAAIRPFMGSRGDLRSRDSRISLTMPLQRLSKDFIPCSGRCLGHGAMELVQSFMIPKSCGMLVMDKIAEYRRHMRALQAERGYTDAEMKRDFVGTYDMLRVDLPMCYGWRRFLRLCFDDVTPSLRVEWRGRFHPFQIFTHRKLRHRILQLDTGMVISITDAKGNEVPESRYWRYPSDWADGFNHDEGIGFVHQ